MNGVLCEDEYCMKPGTVAFSSDIERLPDEIFCKLHAAQHMAELPRNEQAVYKGIVPLTGLETYLIEEKKP